MSVLTLPRDEIVNAETAYVYYFDEENGIWYRCPLSAWEADEMIWRECYPPLQVINGSSSNH